LGIGPNPQSPIPKSPIPNPQSPFVLFKELLNDKYKNDKIIIKINSKLKKFQNEYNKR
jgi:hypothetical protein